MLEVSLEYCRVWNYTERAVRVTATALDEFGAEIKNWILIPSKGGKFELVVNGDLLYSKAETGRHAEEEEIQDILRARLNQKV